MGSCNELSAVVSADIQKQTHRHTLMVHIVAVCLVSLRLLESDRLKEFFEMPEIVKLLA